jgi:hypothetical protein
MPTKKKHVRLEIVLSLMPKEPSLPSAIRRVATPCVFDSLYGKIFEAGDG